MKIAFTSCMLAQRFDRQPVWERIQAADPDYLLLLGDAIYLDIDVAPRRMSDDEFGEHCHALYRAQLAVPEFDALLRHMAAKGGRRVFAIWDDHDFLWNDAAGAAIVEIPEHRDKIPRSRVLFGAFRQALTEVGSFPASFHETQPPAAGDDGPMYEAVPLQDDLWLHLTDGRTCRTETWLVPQRSRAILGQPQLAAMAAAVAAAAPGAVHLVASGSTSAGWKKYLHDWTALNAIADGHRLLMLSGDVHYNVFASHGDADGLALHEATASGAAIRDAVVFGDEIENFGIAEVLAGEVQVRFFHRKGQSRPRRIGRADWTVARQGQGSAWHHAGP
ncbi:MULTISPECIES: alkaline phosphatase D family protein [unclassified Roseateles]|uniref:alkaline phosphatase D family protein n=1 Tax=unclassified Roseateles TaxID=2626991 RepID=UPI000701A969|nr:MULTISPECIES: alkaline phosphatase D family protein [unclassified Roseateles]KQW51971.1 hypothetical protein ASC81_05040 [Pelomonas sp. Root405]KRA78204.1 hypothetical protein ASD88_05045 [Pelomonas sp. Root662]